MKAILITGAGDRVGAYLARELALQADNWLVVIHYNRNETKAQNLAKSIIKLGGHAFCVQANFMDVHSVAGMMDVVYERLQAYKAVLSALINSASLFRDDNIRDFDASSYEAHMMVNLRVPLQLSHDFARLLPAKEKGVIINIIDQRVLRPQPQFFSYYLSKSALYTATKTMAQALAPQIRVCGVGPGPTLPSIYQTPEEFAQECAQTLLKTGSPPAEILGAIRYLLSASSLSGQMIAVDGAQHLSY